MCKSNTYVCPPYFWTKRQGKVPSYVARTAPCPTQKRERNQKHVNSTENALSRKQGRVTYTIEVYITFWAKLC